VFQSGALTVNEHGRDGTSAEREPASLGELSSGHGLSFRRAKFIAV